MYLRNFGRTRVNSAFSCYLASATGWTFPKPPAIFATLPVRWLSFRTNSNLVVLLSISNGRTSANSLAAQILFVNCNRDSRKDASTLSLRLSGFHKMKLSRDRFFQPKITNKRFMNCCWAKRTLPKRINKCDWCLRRLCFALTAAEECEICSFASLNTFTLWHKT